MCKILKTFEKKNVLKYNYKMAKVGSEAGKYPPTEFSQKYAAVLAPKGKLVSPKDVFGEAGVFDADVEEKTKQAFKFKVG